MEDPDGLLSASATSGDESITEEFSINRPMSPPRSVRRFEGVASEGAAEELLPKVPQSSGNLTPRLLLLVCVAAIGGFLFGYDTGVIGGALYYIDLEHKLSPLTQGIVTAATPLGAVAGSLCGGKGSDKWGRKTMVMLASVVFTFGAGLMAFAPSIWVLVVGRVVVGVAVGVASMTVPVYLAESAPEEYRGAVVSVNVLFITSGQFIATVVDLLLQDVHFQWRWMLGLSAVPAVVQFLGILFLHESPRWLAAQGNVAGAKKALAALRGNVDKASADVRAICAAVKADPKGSDMELFTDRINRKALLIGAGVLVLQQFCAINTVMYYTPQIIKNAGVAKQHDVLKWSLIPSAANAMGTIVGMIFIDKLGRRMLLLGSIAMVTLALVAFGLVDKYAPHATVWALVVYLLMFSPGLGPVPWAISSEIFPLRVRGMGMAVGTASNWMANFLISVSFPPLVNWISLSGAAYLYAGLAIISFAFVYSLVPETKGKTLEQVQAILKRSASE